jgi:hypothetical protein
VVILDCLRPVLDALGLSEDKDAGRFLNAGFDPLLREAGRPDGMVIHHMGHHGERARGDSSMLGWGDQWYMVRKNDDPASARYFKAYGRDINVPESELSYEVNTRHLAITGGGSRKESARGENLRIIHAYVREHPGGSQADVVRAFGKDQKVYEPMSDKTVRDAIAYGIAKRVLNPGNSPNGQAMKLTAVDNPSFSDDD